LTWLLPSAAASRRRSIVVDEDWSVVAESGFGHAHIAAVPEPATAGMFGVGVLLLAVRRMGKAAAVGARALGT
jgi:hypothetical protein